MEIIRNNMRNSFFHYTGIIGILCLAQALPAEELRVIYSDLGNGTVTSTPGGINCPSDCDGTFANGTVVTLTATAVAGSTFVRWEGDATGTSNVVSVTMDDDKSVRAVFELTTLIPTFRQFLQRTFVDGAVEVGTDTITIPAHGFVDRQKIRFESPSLPAGLTENRTHFVDLIDSNSFKVLALKFPEGDRKEPVDITGVGGGTHIVYAEGPTAQQVRAYLLANPIVNSPDRFLRALGPEYTHNWILMTRSESLQTGIAKYPRLLLPSVRADFVFTIGLVTHGSFPGSHPNAVEYMQWDPGENNFRFHEIVLDTIPDLPLGGPTTFPSRSRMVSIDDSKCSKCHSTRNVINNSSFAGTTGFPIGSIKVKNKPNWDTYDSWGGMLPFNRDRIYQGSIEAAAFRQTLYLWNWRNSAENDSIRRILEQLELQPPGVRDGPGPVPGTDDHRITRDPDGRIRFGFDPPTLPAIEPLPVGTSPTISVNYLFDRNVGSSTGTDVIRGGEFVTLAHSETPTNDEGRGVQLFDLLGGGDGAESGFPNQMRVADEVISHRFATGSVPIDVRPIALAISDRKVQISGSTVTSTVSGSPLAINIGFFNSRNGRSIAEMVTDTRTRAQVIAPQRDRAQSLTRRRADIQKLNLDRRNDIYLDQTPVAGENQNGLIQEFGSLTTAGTTTSDERLRQEIFRRFSNISSTIEGGPTSPDQSVMGGIYVDRELYSINIEYMALFRFFLEPLGVSVDKWSMGVRGRSRAYNFADIFNSYTNILTGELTDSLTNSIRDPADPTRFLDPENDSDLITMVNLTLGASSLPAPNDMPTFTDVQRIFNKSCIECHGGLNYPPYSNSGTFVDFSEDENPTSVVPPINSRLARSYARATIFSSRIRTLISQTSEACEIGSATPNDLMPCEGPPLTMADIETLRRWIDGPPANPFTHGDPHIRTIDGTRYDFQAAGEFVLLRGIGAEVQARQTAVTTTRPLGPNGHTGLTTCVSVNSAIAARIGNHRVTYQPNLNGKPDPERLQLRIDGELRQLGDEGIRLSSGSQIVRTSAEHGIQIIIGRGGSIVVTPIWWERQSIWIMNIDFRQVRGTQGLMGAIAPGNWLPALPDGKLLGRKPADLADRYKQLYEIFGNAWRVTDETSLFDYAPGTSTKIFTNRIWPREESGDCAAPIPNVPFVPPLAPIPLEEAKKFAAEIIDPVIRENCAQDVMITGDPVFVKLYQLTEQVVGTRPPEPELVFPLNNKIDLAGPVEFHWVPAKREVPAEYKLYVWPTEETPDDNEAELVSLEDFKGKNTFFRRVENLKPGVDYYWKVIAEDENGTITESEVRRFGLK